MDSHKQEIVEKLQAANNILVTVNSNPSVDQLAACIGLTLLLNKLYKHATAVFSGETPSTIEFLKPEDTLEKTTDSLRDFIIALDKSKADKLRYKVEDKVVKIFITPYRTSLSGDDLNFSQGDFNIDVVVALGVHEQSELDQAITAHGRILHDAAVACINNTPAGELGTINWQNTEASSLSELVVDLSKALDKSLMDEQIATALLAGIVAETDRFRNEKTTATTMTLSAELMKAGANQQLVARELDHEVEIHNQSPQAASAPTDNPAEQESGKKSDDGTLEIEHALLDSPEPEQKDTDNDSDDGPTLPTSLMSAATAPPEDPMRFRAPSEDKGRSMITEPPKLGGDLTANYMPEAGNFDPELDAHDPGEEHPTILRREDEIKSEPTAQSAPPELPGGTSVDSAEPLVSSFTPPPMPPRDMPGPAMPNPVSSRPAPAFAPSPSFASPTPAPAPQQQPMASAPVPTPMPPQPAPTPAPQMQYPQPPPMPAPMPPTPRPNPAAPMPAPKPAPAPAPTPNLARESLTELEESIGTSHAAGVDEVERARQEVLKAINEQSDTNLPPVEALNAQPLGGDLHDDKPPAPGAGHPSPQSPAQPNNRAPLPPNLPEAAPMSSSPADQPLTMPLPPNINLPPPQTVPPTNAPSQSPNSPPPVPPPMMPPSF
jgi:hypothetical protein